VIRTNDHQCALHLPSIGGGAVRSHAEPRGWRGWRGERVEVIKIKIKNVLKDRVNGSILMRNHSVYFIIYITNQFNYTMQQWPHFFV